MANDNLLWANRIGTRQYLGENTRGATVKIGMGDGEFTPGELFKLALGTCQALSADHTLSSKLGADFEATVTVNSEKHESEERYTHISSQIITDLTALDENELTKLLERVASAIDKNCTVGHSLKNGVDYEYTLENE
ncbi:OsmC family protein [Actinomyces sp. zg-332]|uniref:OsmC family protein n=1 Tax=Actinomyces sp. zg-332 TaxID=2708340 RepID=UPI00141F1F98|nr:OsmC family protein [Actinomyces sp. zg-332]QPK94579.1 OsmC family protein [Actinomyces sp. zg-332]